MKKLPRGYHMKLSRRDYTAVLRELLSGPKAYSTIIWHAGLDGKTVQPILKDLLDKEIVKSEDIHEFGKDWTRYLIEPTYKQIIENFYSGEKP